VSATGWVSVVDAARRLGVDRHTLYDAAARGEIPARRVGRSVRVPLSWVDGADLDVDTGRTTPDVERVAAQFARAVAVELGRLLGEAAARATAPKPEPGTVLNLFATAHGEGRHEQRTRAV
jgi:excisionase family DNA binding protein